MIETPCYVFDTDRLNSTICEIKKVLGSIPLTYSIKANPFVLRYIQDKICHFEVCSPGELSICKYLEIEPLKIIYSGVLKEESDIVEAIRYGVDIITIESKRQLELVNEISRKEAKVSRIIFRLSSDNQFGMDSNTILELIERIHKYENVQFFGIHYYSGTQKNKIKKIDEDITRLKDLVDIITEKYHMNINLLEYGPGIAIEYFNDNVNDLDLLKYTVQMMNKTFYSIPIGIEMGRFIAAECGEYVTTVKDIKQTNGENYVILDGGTHHIKYYGQMMAMHTPMIKQKEKQCEKIDYCLCGSLCTVSDILARKVRLEKLDIGDEIIFERCGAYSMTEAPALFLSRKMPRIYLKSNSKGIRLVRDFISASDLNKEMNY